MFQTELTYFIVLSLLILFSSALPTGLLLLLDNVLVRLLIVFTLLFLISVGPTAGIFGLVAIASLYLERNRRKVAVALQKVDLMDNRPRLATVEEASQPQKTVPVNAFDTPQEKKSVYMPKDIQDIDKCMDITLFEPVAPTINEKAVLATVYPLKKDAPEAGTGSNQLFEELGYGHIHGVNTVDNVSV
jgi:hypothetical protein